MATTLDLGSMPPAPSLRELADRCFEDLERHIAQGGQLTDDHLAQLQMVLGPNLAKALQLVDAAAAASDAAAARQQQQQDGAEDQAAGPRPTSTTTTPPSSSSKLPHNPVTRVRAAQSGREAFWVSAGSGGAGGGGTGGGRPGSGPAQHYVTLPRVYCSCQSYHFEVATRSVAPFCKHQIAARLCAALGYCRERSYVPDATLAAMLLYG